MSGLWSIRRIIRAATLAGLVATAGCAGPGGSAAGSGPVAFVRGDLEFSLAVSLDRARTVADAAVAELGHTRLSEDGDAPVTVLVSRDAEERRVQIRLESVGPTRTAVRIRVGILGDEAVSMRVRDAILRQL